MLELCVQIAEPVMHLNPPQLSLIKWQIIFTKWQEFLQQEYAIPALEQPTELTLRLTDDREIQELNHQFRKIDRPTDVLAFASLELDVPMIPDQTFYLGDIIISLQTADRQAQQQRWTIAQESIWLASHGLLHLLGWDHPDQSSLEIMWQIQENLLDQANTCVLEHTETLKNMQVCE